MKDEAEICEYGAGDIDEALKQLWIRAIREGSISILPTEENAEKWVKLAQSGISRETVLLLVARIGSKTVGYAFANVSEQSLFNRSESFCFLNDVYVAPEFRRKGIGRRMISECLRRMKAKGFQYVRLTVLPQNKIAFGIFKELGFETFMYGMKKELAV